jgi:hypothetical protein
VQTVLSLEGEQVFALDLLPDGKLLLAISGEKASRLATLDDKDQLQPLQTFEGTRYLWDVVVQGQTIDVATGTEGKVLRVRLDRPADAADRVSTLLDAVQANVLCLVRDAQGRLFAGTDTDGLIYRITVPAQGEPSVFVVYDAAEPEIGALLVQADGTIYAGTADANQARPGRLEKAASAEAGRPSPGPAVEPEVEQPPQVPPQPAPIGQPKADAAAADEAPVEAPTPRVPDNQKEPADAQEEPVQRIAVPRQPASLTRGLETPVVQLQTESPKPAASEAGPAEPATATREQLDQLRQVIRQRLDQARRSGTLQAGPQMQANRARQPRPGAARPGGRAAAMPEKQGNAIYRIGADGFVTEVFRESAMILRLVADQRGGLLVATGNEGQIFHLDPVAQETTIVADLEPQQVAAVLQGPGGELLVGTANPATLVRLTPGFAATGTYTSAVLDATQISLWGKLNVTGTVPQGAGLTVQTRSGNVQDPEQAAWSAWTDPAPVAVVNGRPLTPIAIEVKSPPARFLQYRLNLTSNGQASAVIDEVELAYVVPNLRPTIASITVGEAQPAGPAAPRGPRPAPPRPAPAAPGATGADLPEPVTKIPVQWEATDLNNDHLRFTLQYQMEGSDRWLPLAKDLDVNRYEWDTRRVPDGRYVVRVIASDAADNPAAMALSASRSSDPVLIDNTPPAFEGLAAKVANGVVTLGGKVVDRLSAVADVEFIVDDAELWQTVLPVDLIFDSTDETVSVTIPGLAPGQHVVTVRTRDQLNNARYEALVVEVPRP